MSGSELFFEAQNQPDRSENFQSCSNDCGRLGRKCRNVESGKNLML
jgi:hypothetical protein